MMQLSVGLVLAVSADLLFEDIKGLPTETQFAMFKTKFNKTYSHEEHQERLVIFGENFRVVKELNARESRPPYGITEFMDLSLDEFRSKYHLDTQAEHDRRAGQIGNKKKAKQSIPFNNSTSAADTSWTWCAGGPKGSSPSGCCSPIQYQGICGNCWAFASTEVLETQICIQGGGLTRLSPQELVDCVSGVTCNTGGNTKQGWDFAKKNGIETLKNYPISSASSGRSGSCRGKKVSTGNVQHDDIQIHTTEQSITNLVQTHGPLAISVDANYWQFYDGGASNGDPGCAPLTSSNCGRSTDHAVEIVGLQVGSKYIDNYIVRNHWGTSWGCKAGSTAPLSSKGWVYIKAGEDACGITTQVNHVTVATTPTPPPAPTPAPVPVPVPNSSSLVWVPVDSSASPTDLPENALVIGSQPAPAPGPTYACIVMKNEENEADLVGSLSYAGTLGECRVVTSGKVFYEPSYYVLTQTKTSSTVPVVWVQEPNGINDQSDMPPNSVYATSSSTQSGICRVESYEGETNHVGSISFANVPAVCRIASGGKSYYAKTGWDVMTQAQSPPTPAPTPPPPGPHNECNPNLTCNVCLACCEGYITDGASCDACVAAKCPKNECNPAKTCNVCAGCCESYITDGEACDSCVTAKC